MKRLTHAVVFLLLFGAGAHAHAGDRPALVLVNQSRFDLDGTLKHLRAAAAKQGWKIPKVFNMQATLRKHGHKINPVLVINICKPDLAARLLGSDAHRKLSVMMPCRISVYTDSKGKTHVSRLNTAALAPLLDGKAARVMSRAGRGLEKIIAAVIKR